jgi:hypothetical protein
LDRCQKTPIAKKPRPPFSDWDNKKPHQKLAELIIELTDADLGEVSNIYEAIDTIIAEVSE